MSFFQKLTAFLGLANVALVDANTKDAIGAETEQQLENSLEFHTLLNEQQAETIANYRNEVATLNDSLQAQSERMGDIEASIKAFEDAMATRFSELSQETKAAETTAKELANELNKIKGQPIVKKSDEDKAPELVGATETYKLENDVKAVSQLLKTGFVAPKQ